MGFLQGDWIPHPNSLLFNAFPPFWGLKAFWFFRKVSRTLYIMSPVPASTKLITNFVLIILDGSTVVATGLPDAARGSPRRKETSQLLQFLAPSLSTTKIAKRTDSITTVHCYSISICGQHYTLQETRTNTNFTIG